MKHSVPNAARLMVNDYLKILAGCLLGGLAYPLFLVPNSIAPGGVTGVATILNYLFKYPVGITSLILNIPLFLIGYRSMGRRFVFRTLVATFSFSVMIDLLKIKPLTLDPLMASVFGGALLGMGLAFILKGGATTGGTDMIARMLHKHIPGISVGMYLMFFDCLVILASGFTMSPEHAMHALICVFISSRVLDTVLTGIGTDKVCYIISAKHEEITARILKEMQRGVTLLPGRGGYSGKELSIMLCVVGRLEVGTLKNIVRSEDNAAFVFITDTHETLGEGFHDLSSDNL